MDIRSAIVSMVGEVRGGWTVAAAHLGMTYNALRNRVYETKGQTLSYYEALAIQELSGTTLFVEAFAAASGGTFVKLPDIDKLEHRAVHEIFSDVIVELGEHMKEFTVATADGVIDSAERRSLESLGADIQRKFALMQACMFKMYCRETSTIKLPVRGVANG